MFTVQKLLEQELGRISFEILEKQLPADRLLSLAEKKTYTLLQRIHDILDDQELSDFDCVEEIVCTLEQAGISTSRHDFG